MRPGRAWPGEACLGEARHGLARRGLAGHGKARQGIMRNEFDRKTKEAAFTRANGNCEYCHLSLAGERPEYHHILECAFGGQSTLKNCLVVHKKCHAILTKTVVPAIAKTNRQRRAATGIKRPAVKIKSAGFQKVTKKHRFNRTQLPPRKLYEPYK